MDPILESFEIAAERAGDINPAVYAAYFARCPGSAELMRLVDTHMRGRMMESVLQLFMDEDTNELRNYLRFETTNHESYGVEPHMYENLLSALRDTVRDSVGDAWTARMQQAWDERIARILTEIHSCVAALA